MTDKELHRLMKSSKARDKFIRQPPFIAILQSLAPTYGTCYKCGIPWCFAISRVVKISEYGGAFAMCEYCWSRSTVDERIECHKKLWHAWVEDNKGPDALPCTLLQMEGAVIIASEATEQ